MRTSTLALCLFALPALADTDSFFGWAKDGTFFVYQQVSGPNDLTELFFCPTEDGVPPTWPKELNELERVGTPACIRYTDVNRAPYGWKAALVLPKPTVQGPGARVLSELVTDGERPGYAYEIAGKKTVCYASGLHEDSKLGHVFWHPNGRFVAAFIDGRFIHCDVPLKAGPPVGKQPPTRPPPPKKKTK